MTGGGVIIGRAPATRPTIDASTIGGRHGGLTWHGYRAADVVRYTVTRSAIERGLRRWMLCGPVAQVNPFTLTQRPLVFVAPHQLGAWYWPVIDLTIEDGLCVAALGVPILPETVQQTAHVQQLVQQQQPQALAPAQLQRLVRQQLVTR